MEPQKTTFGLSLYSGGSRHKLSHQRPLLDQQLTALLTHLPSVTCVGYSLRFPTPYPDHSSSSSFEPSSTKSTTSAIGMLSLMPSRVRVYSCVGNQLLHNQAGKASLRCNVKQQKIDKLPPDSSIHPLGVGSRTPRKEITASQRIHSRSTDPESSRKRKVPTTCGVCSDYRFHTPPC